MIIILQLLAVEVICDVFGRLIKDLDRDDVDDEISVSFLSEEPVV